jgi:hypothetical protein
MLQRMDRNSGRNGPNGDADAELARPTFDDYRLVLARAAVVMMAVALLLIGYLVFRLAGIASHAGLFKVILVLGTFLVIAIAGLTLLLVLPLLRGSLRAAPVIAWLAAASLVSGIGIWMALPLLLPQIFLPPPELLLTEFRLNPAEATIQQLSARGPAVFELWVCFWIYRQLRTPSVREARAAIGRTTRPPNVAFVLGAGLVVLFAVVMRLTFTGDVIDKAVQLAQAQLGKGYKYHVSAIHSESNWQTRRVSAVVTAYNPHEIRAVPVEWQESTRAPSAASR